jgi:hypothetical protein
MNPTDRLKALQASRLRVTPPPPEEKGTAKKGLDLRLDVEEQQAGIDFITASVALGSIAKDVENLKDTFDKICRKKFYRMLWDSKARPDSPRVKILTNGEVEYEETYVFAGKFTVAKPKVVSGEAASDVFRDLLVSNGMDTIRAAALVNQELTWETLDSVLPVQTDTDDADLAEAIASLYEYLFTPGAPPLKLSLSDDVKARFYQRTTSAMTVNKGFLDRVCLYCKTYEELELVLAAITPQMQHKFCKAWENLSATTQTQKRLETICNLLKIDQSMILRVASQMKADTTSAAG